MRNVRFAVLTLLALVVSGYLVHTSYDDARHTASRDATAQHRAKHRAATEKKATSGGASKRAGTRHRPSAKARALRQLAGRGTSGGGVCAKRPTLPRCTAPPVPTTTSANPTVTTSTSTPTSAAPTLSAPPTSATTSTSVPTSSAPPTTSAPPTSGPSGTCTQPVWTGSAATATYQPSDTWWVNNNAWSGGHGPQTMYACSPSSWYVTSNQPDMGGQVQTYPDTQYNTNSTKTIGQYNSITSTFSEAFPAAGSWDAMYDIWLNNYSTEIMIWNEWTGTNLYWPNDKSTTVVIGGVPYWFQNNGGIFVFFRQTMVKSGSVDLLAAMKYLVGRGLIKSTDVPTQLEYGVEICSTAGTQTFPMTGLTFNLS